MMKMRPKAITEFHEHQMDGRALVVNEARPKPEGGFGGGGGGGRGRGGGGGGGYRGGGGGGGGDYGGGGGKTRASLVGSSFGRQCQMPE